MKEKLQKILEVNGDVAEITTLVTELITEHDTLIAERDKLTNNNTELQTKYTKTLEANQTLISSLGTKINEKKDDHKEEIIDDIEKEEKYKNDIKKLEL